MSVSTPFFPGFARILFGRPPVDAAVTALKEAVRSDEAISELAASFGHFFGAPLKEGLARDEEEPVEYRDRCYT